MRHLKVTLRHLLENSFATFNGDVATLTERQLFVFDGVVATFNEIQLCDI